ncbi:MAG: TlpA disulfide reductase family protein [Pseudomonadota bacterium]
MRAILKRGPVVAIIVGLTFVGIGLGVGLYTSSDVSNGQLATLTSTSQLPKNPVETLLAQRMATPDGTIQSLAQWKGRKIVVNFWATWCAPCVEEMPALSAMQQALTPEVVQILGIGIDTPANIAAFSTRYGIAYPVFSTGIAGTELMRQFGNTGGGLPYSVLIDGNGKIVRTYLGKLDIDALRRDIVTLAPAM